MYFEWRPYVSVAQRRANAAKKLAAMAKKGYQPAPIKIEGRKIAATFWGQSWCQNLEAYSDFANRLPRGRSYVRNGSVVDLQIEAGQVNALVAGSELYKVKIDFAALNKALWKEIKSRSAGRIGSLVDLLQGKLSQDVMSVVTCREKGLFPKPSEIGMDCSCPDWADMCKHVAAVLYGVGARLDRQPELLFKLRQVDHFELIAAAGDAAMTQPTVRGKPTIATADLGDVFGIELDEPSATEAQPVTKPGRTAKVVVARVSKSAKSAPLGKQRRPKKTMKQATTTSAKKNRSATAGVSARATSGVRRSAKAKTPK